MGSCADGEDVGGYSCSQFVPFRPSPLHTPPEIHQQADCGTYESRPGDGWFTAGGVGFVAPGALILVVLVAQHVVL